MKKKGIVIFIIAVSLAVTVSLTGFTYAWFINVDTVYTQPTTITTAPTLLSLDISPIGNNRYMGQTGKDAELDSPFKKNFNLILRCNTEQSNNVNMNIKEVFIKMWNYIPPIGEQEEKNFHRLTEDMIEENFTFRLSLNGITYIPDRNGFLYTYENNFIRYLVVNNGDIVDGMLSLIYLGEQSYIKWQLHDFDSYEEFAYCSPDYMDSTFSFNFQFSLGKADLEYNDKLLFDVTDNNFVPKSGDTLANTYKYTLNKSFIRYTDINRTLKAYISSVQVIKRDGEYEDLTAQQISDNFTLRIKSDNIEYKPDQNNYFHIAYGQSIEWLFMKSNELSELDISVIGQDELDYSNMLSNPSYVSTPSAYAGAEYYGAKFVFDIAFEMQTTSQEDNSYEVQTQVVFGLANNPAMYQPAYNGETGLNSQSLYAFNKEILLTPSSTKTIKATIQGITIVHANGQVQTLTANQIKNNFTLRFGYGGNVYGPYSGYISNRENYFYRSIGILQNEWLEIPQNVVTQLQISIIYQDESDYSKLLEEQTSSLSAFAFTAAEYATASFYFDIHIEMVNTP